MSEVSRRDLLVRGIAVGGATVGASLAPLLLHVRTAFAAADSDESVIAAAVGLEEVAVFAYDAAIAGNLLDGPTARIARLFKAHEEAHRDALKAALGRLGGTAPPPPTGPAGNELLAPLAKAKSQQDVVTAAMQIETATVAAYYDAHGKLKAPGLLRAVAGIMADEGQHLVVLRTALHLPPAPNAFETGNPSQ